jgi:hypothetical protein
MSLSRSHGWAALQGFYPAPPMCRKGEAEILALGIPAR